MRHTLSTSHTLARLRGGKEDFSNTRTHLGPDWWMKQGFLRGFPAFLSQFSRHSDTEEPARPALVQHLWAHWTRIFRSLVHTRPDRRTTRTSLNWGYCISIGDENAHRHSTFSNRFSGLLRENCHFSWSCTNQSNHWILIVNNKIVLNYKFYLIKIFLYITAT